MDIRLVAIDIDGTLLNSDEEISPANFAAIHQTMARGIEVVLLTGRRLATARWIPQQLGLGGPFVVHNGALILQMASGLPLARFFLSPPTAREVLERSHLFLDAILLHVEDGEDGLMAVHPASAANPILQRYLSRNHQRVVHTEQLNIFANERLIQIMFAGHTKQIDDIETQLACIQEPLPPHITKTCYPDRDFSIMDILDRKCSKAQALKFLSSRNGIARNQILAIGDNHNDLDMLLFAGTGVAMGNAVRELKDTAFFVTGCNNSDGVAQALEQFILQT
jgi:Cof subfamily protein (haloacid dehalogenase superfamily)